MLMMLITLSKGKRGKTRTVANVNTGENIYTQLLNTIGKNSLTLR